MAQINVLIIPRQNRILNIPALSLQNHIVWVWSFENCCWSSGISDFSWIIRSIRHNHTNYAGVEGKGNKRDKMRNLSTNLNTRQFSQNLTSSQLFSYRIVFSSKRVLAENTIFAHTCLNTHSYGFSFLVFTGALVTFSSQFTHIMCFFLPLATVKQSFKRDSQEKKFLSLIFFSLT